VPGVGDNSGVVACESQNITSQGKDSLNRNPHMDYVTIIIMDKLIYISE
jgi:hypothetical protein